MKVFDFKQYRKFVEFCLNGQGGERKRGAVKRLAESVKCHPTYISQVVNGRSHFNSEQTLAFANYFQLAPEEIEFFVDLVARDRAGNTQTRTFFDNRLKVRLKDRQDLTKRWQLSKELSVEEESIYYTSWIPQVIHMMCQLPGTHTIESMADRLGQHPRDIRMFCEDLERIGILESRGEVYTCLKDVIHLGKSSKAYMKSHANLRFKTMSDLMLPMTEEALHYSSVVSLSKKAAKKIKEIVTEHLEEVRGKVLESPAEEVYLHCMDFYPLFRNPLD